MKLVFAASLALCLSACATRNPSPDEVRDRTAKATETVKQDTKAIAEGIREGISSDKSGSKLVDINTAGKDTLTALPGVDDERADRIIANRPYSSAHQLVTKHVMSQTEYDKISGRVTAK